MKRNSPIGELKHHSSPYYKSKVNKIKFTMPSTLSSKAYKALKEAKEKVRTKRTTSDQPAMRWVPKHQRQTNPNQIQRTSPKRKVDYKTIKSEVYTIRVISHFDPVEQK